jgi:hypothetical protein
VENERGGVVPIVERRGEQEDGGIKSDHGLGLVLHSIALAFNDDGFGVVEEAIQDGRSDGAVVVEDRGPLPSCPDTDQVSRPLL